MDQSRLRARLFDLDGQLLADSFRLVGPGGRVDIQELPAASALSPHETWITDLYDWVVNWLPRKAPFPPYHEPNNQSAADYEEAVRALLAEVRKGGTALALAEQNEGFAKSLEVPFMEVRWESLFTKEAA